MNVKRKRDSMRPATRIHLTESTQSELYSPLQPIMKSMMIFFARSKADEFLIPMGYGLMK